MAKLTLNNLGDLRDATTAASNINANNDRIEVALENTLSRDGTGPNQMGANFDMNSHDIINLPTPTLPTSPLRLQDLESFISPDGTSLYQPRADVLTSISSHGTSPGYITVIGDGTVATRTFTANTATGLAVTNGVGDTHTEYSINPAVLKPTLALAKADVGLGNVDNTSDATKNSASATLTNKTLTSPVINTPTGISKTDVGLSNVDNTSDSTKNSASVTLTNKTLTSPVINSPTGIVKADVGLGSVDNTSDATKNAAAVTLTNKTISGASNTLTARIANDVSGLATGVATFLTTPTSANLKAAVTDETGSGALVFASSPALVTPTGIVKGDVGLGNVDNTSDATKNSAVATLSNKTLTGVSDGSNAAVGAVGEIRQSNAPNSTSTITITIASPAVVTWTGHSFSTDGLSPVSITTTGALPTGLTAGTVYWTVPGTVTANTFQLATSIANAVAGTAINTTGSQSGTHTGNGTLTLTTGTNLNFCALDLPAGDWDVTGTLGLALGATTNVTYIAACFATAIATNDQTPGRLTAIGYGSGSVLGATVNHQFSLPTSRLSLSSRTTVYANAQVGFTVSTATAFGSLRARRIR